MAQPLTSGGAGSSVQYTEGVASAATPIGTVKTLISQQAAFFPDVVGGDGINVSARGTYKGETYVKHVDVVTVAGGVIVGSAAPSVIALHTAPAGSTAELAALTENRLQHLSVDLQGALRTTQAARTVALDYDVSNNPIYVGYAVHGSAKSAAVWQIRKLTFDGSNNVTDMQFANGAQAFNAIWNNRASLSYS